MSESKNTLFLANPKSGGRRGEQLLRALNAYAAEHADKLTVVALGQAGLSNQLLQDNQYTHIFIAGGDGTVSATLNQLGDVSAKIAVVPLGTGNDLARELGISGHVASYTIKDLFSYYASLDSRPVNLSLVEFADIKKYFVNYVSIGFDACVIEQFEKWRSSNFGRIVSGVYSNRLAYASISLKNAFDKKHCFQNLELVSASNVYSIDLCSSIFFANIKSVMGLGASNLTGSAYDSDIEAVLVSKLWEFLGMLTSYRFGPKPVLLGSDSSWQLSGMNHGTSVQIDGEVMPKFEGGILKIGIGKRVDMLGEALKFT